MRDSTKQIRNMRSMVFSTLYVNNLLKNNFNHSDYQSVKDKFLYTYKLVVQMYQLAETPTSKNLVKDTYKMIQKRLKEANLWYNRDIFNDVIRGLSQDDLIILKNLNTLE